MGIIILKIILAILYSALMLCIIMFIKTIFAFRNHSKIISAIYNYNVECIYSNLYENIIEQNESEDLGQTLFRLWDWGYENILPKETFEKVKPYIRR